MDKDKGTSMESVWNHLVELARHRQTMPQHADATDGLKYELYEKQPKVQLPKTGVILQSSGEGLDAGLPEPGLWW